MDVAAARAAWPAETTDGIGGIAPERLVFLDQCGVLTDMARLRGRSPRGTRAVGTVPFGHWTRLTVLGALGIGGMPATMATEAATGGAVFLAYLEQVPLPEPRRTKPDAVLVLDNLRAHKTAAVRRLLDHSGFLYRYLPVYSPDLSPVRGTAPDARLGQAEGGTAPCGRAHRRGAAAGPRSRARHHHRPGRRRLLPPCRLPPSQLNCGLL